VSRAQLEVRRSIGLSAAITLAAAALAVLFSWRAWHDGGVIAPIMAVGFAVLAVVWAVCLLDARVPLLVIDRQGLRLRFSNQWVGLPWGQLDGVEHRRGLFGLRDGRLVPLGVNPEVLNLLSRRARFHARAMTLLYGSPFAVPLGLATRLVGAGDDVAAALARLTAGGVIDSSASPSADEPIAGGDVEQAELHDFAVDPLTAPWVELADAPVEDPKLTEAESLDPVLMDPDSTELESLDPEPQDPESLDPEADHPESLDPEADQAAAQDAVAEPTLPGKRRADVLADASYQPSSAASTWMALQSGTDWNRQPDREDPGQATSALSGSTSRLTGVVSPLLRDPRPVVAAGLARLADLGRGGPWATSGANALAVDFDQALDVDQTVEVERVVLSGPVAAAAVTELGAEEGADDAVEATREVHGLAKQLVAGAETEVLPAQRTRPAPELGPRLRSARNARGLSRRQVAARAGIPVEVLVALESDDFEPSGGDFYVRGQVRTLGRVLGFDAEPLVADYDRWFAGREIDANRVFDVVAVDSSTARPRLPRGILLGALCLALVLAAAQIVG
jgi:transcriptional regulator with XRE-family HTH domain